MKPISFLALFIFISFSVYGQKKKFKIPKKKIQDELLLKEYPADTSATALVLYESANIYMEEKSDFNFRTDYYFRIKLFDKTAFHKANIRIPFQNNEKITDVKATSYNWVDNKINKSTLDEDDVYIIEKDNGWNEAKFAMPQIKEGTVIEYAYSITSPRLRLYDWYFQSDIPKVKSDFDASIVGNYNYNLRLFGFHTLSKKEQTAKRNCVDIPGIGIGGCNIYSFSMDSIPAFVEEEFMLSKRNYMSRLVFDLISITSISGGKENFTNTWEKTDDTLKKYILDNQTDKIRFFRRHLPENTITTENQMSRAKQIYAHLQNRLSWNGKNRTRYDLNIKDVYKNRTGSADAINLILYNSLKAADVEAYVVASSTRDHGLPTKIYPNSRDFNYTLVKAVIDNKTYFLDATDKKLAFGQVPVKCLNGEGRVLYTHKEGHWEKITTTAPTYEEVNISLDFIENKGLSGDLDITKNGYLSLFERKRMKNKTEDEYLDYFQNKTENIKINTYTVQNEEELEKPLQQNFKISFEGGTSQNILFNPFIIKKISRNPFKMENRQYPVNYGYTRTYVYSIEINYPENYKIIGLPDSKKIRLPDLGGSYTLNTVQETNKIKLYSKLVFNKDVYGPNEYKYLKKLYDEIISTEDIYIQLKSISK